MEIKFSEAHYSGRLHMAKAAVVEGEAGDGLRGFCTNVH